MQKNNWIRRWKIGTWTFKRNEKRRNRRRKNKNNVECENIDLEEPKTKIKVETCLLQT